MIGNIYPKIKIKRMNNGTKTSNNNHSTNFRKKYNGEGENSDFLTFGRKCDKMKRKKREEKQRVRQKKDYYLQSEDSSQSITKILNGLLFLSCLQLLKWHIFVTPATNSNSNFLLKLQRKNRWRDYFIS